MAMSRSVYLCVRGFMFEIVSLLSTIGMNTKKNPIWSILVFYAVSLYLTPMQSNIIKATYDTIGVISRSQTDTRSHLDTNCWILMILI